ncbi:Type I restriction enzyme EcoKI M protein [compost metagenome]
MIKGQKVENIKLGNTLSDDQLAGGKFDFMLSNPPFGVEWKKVQKRITDEHSEKGFAGRFGPGLPRVSDGSLLFLLHLTSKMRDPREGGSRIGIILNGSPLFTGGAGSGESEIRRYLLQNDLVEAIIALPTDMFYNTGIATYVWVLCNHKAAARKGKVQLVDGTQHYSKMRKSLGSKRQFINDEQIDDLVRLYGHFEQTAQSKIFPIDAFGYRRITVERPLRLSFQTSPERIERVLEEKTMQKLDDDARQRLLAALQSMDAGIVHRNREQFAKLLKKTLAGHGISLSTAEQKAVMNALGERDPEADICMTKGQPEADSGLRDFENVPLGESIYAYFTREVKPHVPDAWIDESKRDAQDGEVGIVGFEIPFNRHFYVFQPPRPLEAIDRDLKACTDRIKQMIEALSA